MHHRGTAHCRARPKGQPMSQAHPLGQHQISCFETGAEEKSDRSLAVHAGLPTSWALFSFPQHIVFPPLEKQSSKTREIKQRGALQILPNLVAAAPSKKATTGWSSLEPIRCQQPFRKKKARATKNSKKENFTVCVFFFWSFVPRLAAKDAARFVLLPSVLLCFALLINAVSTPRETSSVQRLLALWRVVYFSFNCCFVVA